MKDTLAAALVMLICFNATRTTAQQLMKIDSPPPGAAFHSLQNPDQPPLPFVPFPKLDIYWWDGIFFFDDSEVDYVTLKSKSSEDTMTKMSGPPVPGPGGGGGGGGGSTTFPPPYNYSSNVLWVEISSPTQNDATLTLHNTGPDTNYMFFSRQLLGSGLWNVEAEGVGLLETNIVSVRVPLNGRTNLFFAGGVGIDSDGDGLADAYEALVTRTDPFDGDTGDTGLPDGYKDADGDGWTNLDEFRNQQNPDGLNSPPALTGVFRMTDANNQNVVEWSPPPALANSFTIERRIGSTWEFVATVAGDVSSFTDTTLAPGTPAEYRVRSNYASISSPFASSESSAPNTSEPAYTFPATIAKGPGGRLFYVAAAGETELATHQIQRQGAESIHPKNYIFEVTDDYPQSFFIPVSGTSISELPAASVTNGPALISSDFLPHHGWYFLAFRQVGKDGRLGNLVAGDGYFDATPFLDGRQHLIDNLTFSLRAGDANQPFNFTFGPFGGPFSAGAAYGIFPSYSVAGFHWMQHIYTVTFEVFDAYRPFEDNAIFRNFCFNASEFNSQGHPLTGVSYEAMPMLEHWLHNFNSLTYAQAGRTDVPPNLLTTAAGQYTFYRTAGNGEDLSAIGLVYDGNPGWRMSAGARNYYGLPYRSVRAVVYGPDPHPLDVRTVQPGGTLAAVGSTAQGRGAYFFTDTEIPVLNTVGFHFADPNVRDCPGRPSWNGVNLTNQFLIGFGKRASVAAWAKKAIENGYSDKFGYLQLYFDKAFKMAANGTVTTNETGILSEYGDFFPTEPGRVALRTKPDLTGGPTADVVVHVIKLELDVNHDGQMDGRFHGPDGTTAGRPFVFWVNNDYDRHDPDIDNTDDLPPTSRDLAEKVPDFAVTNLFGPAITSMRDLEDYARLWTTGITNLLPLLPANAVIELSWRTTSPQNPTLHLFRAVEADGGTGYLTDESTAQQQQQSVTYFRGAISSTNAVQLNLSGLATTEKYLFCGAKRGSGELVLRVRIGTATVGETSAFIQIKDIKEMYERWSVGDSPGAAPLPLARPHGGGLPAGVPAFQYPHSPARDANTPYILFVHGWNTDGYGKDVRAETSFKRLYWQGYRGRFGAFRWPTTYDYPLRDLDTGASFDPFNHFDFGEFQSWRSAQGLRRLFTRLNRRYPGQVRVFAHSQGVVVTGEALKLATEPLVAVYVAMQGALASHAYDATRPVRQIPFIYDDGTPNLYANYWTAGNPPYFNTVAGAARHVNFYNPVDYALRADRWQLDQDLKPNGTLGYRYNQEFQHWVGENYRVLTAPTNTYELFSFCVESRCFALGQQAQVGRAFDPGAEVLLDPTFAFGDQPKGHSAQFRSTNMRRAAFWRQLLTSFQLAP